MPQTPTQICNSALLKIGGRTVSSYTGDTTKEGTLVQEQFPKTLHYVCRSHVWHFLKTFADLTGVATTSLSPWTHTVTLPADCLRILSVSVENYAVPYEQHGSTLYVRDAEVTLRYIRQPVLAAVADDPETEENEAVAADTFPDDFAEAVAYRLAGDISVSLTQNADLKQLMYTEYMEAIRTARFNGACEIADQTIPATEWLDSRDSYGDTNPYPNKIA